MAQYLMAQYLMVHVLSIVVAYVTISVEVLAQIKAKFKALATEPQ